ncbi:tetratricopeptide repeat protein [bacterium]|nr:tetratricopeptide repeat protein [bacterium]
MEVAMSLPVLLLLVGFAYVVLVGGLSLFRREGLSLRFAIEAVILTGLASGLVALTGFYVHPVLFLLVLYLITMRVRLLVDIGTTLAKSGRLLQAESVYQLAARLWPDQTGLLVLQVNRGTALMQAGKLDEAIAMLKGVLGRSEQGYLGVKYEAAAHYNLGVAYLRKNQNAQAVIEFNAVLNTWPASEHARRAAAALEKHRHSEAPEPVEEEK